MKLALSLLFGLCATACSSADFAVTGEDSGGTGGDSIATDDTGNSTTESGVDAVVDPCAPEPGIAKFCVDVKLEHSDHPGYDATSGASSLGIDGKGIVYVSLFDKDPATDLGGASPIPKAVLQYPPADHVGEQAGIDKDLPLTMTGRAAPGTYWVITQFADSEAKRGTGEAAVLPGDFVIVPNVNASTRKTEYPKLTLTTGETGRVEQKLRPYRRVDVDMGVTADLNGQAMTNASIHGDGPVLFAIYDGDFNAMPSPNILSVAGVQCLSVHPAMIPPVRTATSFGTTVDGEHKLFALLFDYKLDIKPSNAGNIYTQTVAGMVNPIPKVNISATSWVSSTKADFTAVYFPYDATSAPADPLTCK